MTFSLSSLNDNQRRAAQWDDGPMLVLASPGSGKTRVLTVRIARLLEQQPDVSVLALTFTNKAASEMRERVDLLVGGRADRVSLSTFHAYATQILRQHGSHVGVSPDFSLVSQDEDRLAQLEPIARDLSAAGHGVPTDRHSLLRLIDHLFRESYDGGSNAAGLTTTPPWVAPLFSGYCDSLLDANRQDFGSLLHTACRLLREKPAVARVLRVGWSHICVDEFQDTNRAQYELLKLLAPPPKANLFVVGDDDQILYQWNGASPDRLTTLRADYDMTLVQLPENYRCPSEIIKLANNLIRHNTQRSADKLPLAAHRAPSADGGIIRYQELDAPDAEAAFVASDILARGADATNCVVLARTTKLLEGAARALAAAGATPYLARTRTAFESAPIRVVLLALRLANARHDRELLRRLCVAWKALTERTVEVEAVIASATLVGGDFLRAWAEAATAHDEPGRLVLEKVRAALVERLEFPGIVDWFLDAEWSAWRDAFDEFDEELAIWANFHGEHVREYTLTNVTLHAYLQSFDLATKVSPPPPGAVRCLTVHGSKGLEFKHVYLIGMAQEVLPSFQALKKGPASREVEEERRNCFVAITRAQETLTLTRALTYNGWPKERSQFLSEMAGRER